ncbi:MAG: XdhC/CoxI family protein [Spirochaetia bacterium]
MSLLDRVNELLEHEETFCLVTVVHPDRADSIPLGCKLIVLPDGSVAGEGERIQVPSELPALALRALSERKRSLVELENGVRAFIDLLSGEPKLLICGAGHIAMPLASFARQVGFTVTVLDDRPDFANPSRFPGCTVITEDFTDALRDMPLGSSTYVVVITRGHENDTECLLELLRKETAYVGLIGSRRRIEFVMEILVHEGIRRDRLEEIFTPIGLPVGAESPAEIALCIAAELVCVRNAGVEMARSLRTAAGGAK